MVKKERKLSEMNLFRNTNIKRNGFSNSVNFYQIITWTLEISKITIFIIYSLSTITIGLKIFFGIVYFGVTLTVLILGFSVTNSDPTDGNIKIIKKKVVVLDPTRKTQFYCTVCEAYIGNKTKHCGQCNRCVSEFDHHCKWLNNCIGGRNYKKFIVLLIFTIAQSLVGMIIVLLQLYNLYYEIDSDFFAFSEIKGREEEFRIGFIFFLCQETPQLIVIFDLLFLHAYLRLKGLSTYQYILDKRKKKEMKVVQKSKSKLASSTNSLDHLKALEQSKTKTKKHVIIKLKEESKDEAGELEKSTKLKYNQVKHLAVQLNTKHRNTKHSTEQVKGGFKGQTLEEHKSLSFSEGSSLTNANVSQIQSFQIEDKAIMLSNVKKDMSIPHLHK